MLRISEAAARLGVTPTTLRRWEKQGRIHPVRTAGGERRYAEPEVDQVAAQSDNVRAAEPNDGRALGKRQKAVDWSPMDDLEDGESDADFSLPAALTPARLSGRSGRDSRARTVDDDIAAFERGERDAAAMSDRRAREAARVAANQEAQLESLRLVTLRQHGDMLAMMAGAPVEYRAEVTRDLVSYVTPAQFPASASYQAYEVVKARVERTLKPWRDEQEELRRDAEREAEKTRRRRQRGDLRADGLAHAELMTLSWRSDDRSEAMAEVEAALREDARSDWTRDDVARLVDEVLEEWD